MVGPGQKSWKNAKNGELPIGKKNRAAEERPRGKRGYSIGAKGSGSQDRLANRGTEKSLPAPHQKERGSGGVSSHVTAQEKTSGNPARDMVQKKRRISVRGKTDVRGCGAGTGV